MTTPYGSSAYGGGQPTSPGEVYVWMRFAGQAGVPSNAMRVIKGSGNMALYTSAPDPEDITLATTLGPDTLHAAPAGQASVTMGQGQSYTVATTSDGRAVIEFGLGRVNPVGSTSAGSATFTQVGPAILPPLHQGDIYVEESSPNPGDILVETDTGPNSLATDPAGAATVTMGMGRVNPISSTSNGEAGWPNTLGLRSLNFGFSIGVATMHPSLTIQAFDTDVYLYTSGAFPNDVYLAPEAGPGINKSLLSTHTGVGSMTATMNRQRDFLSTSAGVSTHQAYLGSPARVESLSAGRTTVRDQFGTTGFWYLGSSVRMTSTAAGRGGTKDQFGTLGKWYLGSSARIEAISAGKGGARDQLGNVGKWYQSGAVYISANAAGLATAIGYLGSPFQIFSTSAGRATGVVYLGSPFRVFSTAAGRATAVGYMSSPIPFETRINGRTHAFNYLGSAVYFLFGSAFSSGRGGGQNYLASPFDLPEAIANGRSANLAHLAGLVFLNQRAIKGVATASMQPHRGPQHYGVGAFTSRGVSTMFLDPGLLYMTSNGVGRVANIPRPTDVFMQWGLGPFFYERHFPVIEALLIPKGSNGMSYVSIEIDTIPIMHQHCDGVGGMIQIQDGIERKSRMQTITGGCYDWTVFGDDAEAGLVGTRRPWFGTVGALNVAENDFVYRRLTAAKEFLSIKMTLTPTPVVWNPNGIGKCTMKPHINFFRRWQTWEDGEPFFPTWPTTPGGYNGPHYAPQVPNFGGTRRAGGVGVMRFKGPLPVSGVSAGRANIGVINRMGVAYASNLLAAGRSVNHFDQRLAHALLTLMEGEATARLVSPQEALERYGNMLRYFFVPLPDYGQVWPRKERQHAQPV